MTGNLHILRAFYQTGRKSNGGFMGENECALNATQRNLSLLSDAELQALKAAALLLVAEIEGTYQERWMDDAVPSDAVLACPDCDRPNQFGEVCGSCERDLQDEIAEANAD